MGVSAATEVALRWCCWLKNGRTCVCMCVRESPRQSINLTIHATSAGSSAATVSAARRLKCFRFYSWWEFIKRKKKKSGLRPVAFTAQSDKRTKIVYWRRQERGSSLLPLLWLEDPFRLTLRDAAVRVHHPERHTSTFLKCVVTRFRDLQVGGISHSRGTPTASCTDVEFTSHIVSRTPSKKI